MQRWGDTGTPGQCKVEGPMELSEVESALAQVFEEKTGKTWGSVQRGDRAEPGKYWLQQQSRPDQKAKWEYYVGDRVDGKRDGWYPYDPAASEEVEALYAQHIANGCESRTLTRVVASGNLGFKYQVDLSAMTQQNTRTKKTREIRRALEGSTPSASQSAPPEMSMKVGRRAAMGVAMKRAMKVAKRRPMKKLAMKVAKKRPMKAMKVKSSKIARGKRARALVLSGKKEKTTKGLRAADLMRNRWGRIVSRKVSGKSQENAWILATKRARATLGITGFCPVGGASDLGKRLLAEVRSVYLS